MFLIALRSTSNVLGVLQNADNSREAGEEELEDMEEIDQRDDGYIELVLRVLARMCDGQHSGLQVRYES